VIFSFPFSLWKPSGGFNPAALNLSLWVDASLAAFNVGASTWAGNASAGTSGGNSLSMPATYGTVGSTTLNTFSIPLWSGAGGEALSVAGKTTSDFFTSGAGTIGALIKLTTITNNAAAGSPFNNDQIFSGASANIGVGAYSGGPGIDGWLFDTAFEEAKSTGLSTTAFHWIWYGWNGTNVYTSVDGNALVSTAATSPALGEILYWGCDVSGAHDMTGSIAMAIHSPLALSTSVRDQFRARCFTQFGVTV
jgi:hypothetical protein